MAVESILDGDSCRSQDAQRMCWALQDEGSQTVEQLRTKIHRGVSYTHGLLKELEQEGRVQLSEANSVSGRLATLSPSAEEIEEP